MYTCMHQYASMYRTHGVHCFFFFRRWPDHVRCCRHWSIKFWGILRYPSLYHGDTWGFPLNLTLKYFLLFCFFRSTTSSTSCWTSVGPWSCLALAVSLLVWLPTEPWPCFWPCERVESVPWSFSLLGSFMRSRSRSCRRMRLSQGK